MTSLDISSFQICTWTETDYDYFYIVMIGHPLMFPVSGGFYANISCKYNTCNITLVKTR